MSPQHGQEVASAYGRAIHSLLKSGLRETAVVPPDLLAVPSTLAVS
jgi:hypothetical protein